MIDSPKILNIFEETQSDLMPVSYSRQSASSLDATQFSSDTLTRSITNPESNFTISSTCNTSDLIDYFYRIIGEITERTALAVSFASWQKNKFDYNGIYNALLLGAISEEDFEEEAEKFVYEIRNLSDHEIQDISRKITDLMPFEVTTSDLSDYMKIEPRSLLSALAKDNNLTLNLRALLPSKN